MVLEGFYHEAENLMLTIPLNAQRDIIMDLAYDTESIAIYGFLRYMLEKNKTKYLLEMTIDVMINPLCFVEGAYETSFDIYKKTVIDMILVPESEILWSRGRNFPVTGQQSWKSVGATQSEFIYLYRK